MKGTAQMESKRKARRGRGASDNVGPSSTVVCTLLMKSLWGDGLVRRVGGANDDLDASHASACTLLTKSIWGDGLVRRIGGRMAAVFCTTPCITLTYFSATRSLSMGNSHIKLALYLRNLDSSPPIVNARVLSSATDRSCAISIDDLNLSTCASP